MESTNKSSQKEKTSEKKELKKEELKNTLGGISPEKGQREDPCTMCKKRCYTAK